jgi:hypothetical protein
MDNPDKLEDLMKFVQSLLKQGAANDDLVMRRGRAAQALPVVDRRGALYSWFVGILVDDRLVGFFQFSPDLTFQRYSSFMRQPGQVETCPSADTWLDPDTILARARPLLQPGEAAGKPYLSFDRSPDRLAWAVPVSSEADQRQIYVTGEYAYPAVEDSDVTG